MSDIASILNKAADLIEPEGAWTNDWGSRDRRGNGVGWGDKRATCWSAYEAILRVCRYASDAETALRFWTYEPTDTQAEAVAKLRNAALRALAAQEPSS